MTFHLKESFEEHTSTLSSLLTSSTREHSLLLVTEEGWLLPTSRLLLTLHSPLLAPLLSSSSSLSIPAPASTLSSLLTTLSTGSSSPSSMGEVREVEELATTLGIPLTNTAAELQRSREMKTTITFNPDPLGTKREHSEKKPRTKKKAKRKETTPANFEAFSKREEGLGQWAGAENGDKPETRVKEEDIADNIPMEVVLVPEILAEASVEQVGSDESSLVTEEFDPTNHLTTNVETQSQPEQPAPTAVEVPEEWPCNMCPKKFAKEVFLESHKTNRHDTTGPKEAIQEWSCSDCPKKFSGEEHLSKHYSRIHKKLQKGIYPCGLCAKSFDTVPEFNNHKVSVHMGKCTICGLEMLKKSLMEHMKNKHSEKSPKT